MLKTVSPKQAVKILITHIKTSALIFIVCVVFLSGMLTNDIAKKIFCVITTLLYMLSIYNCANTIYHNDNKSYTPETPHKLKGLILPTGLLICNVLIVILHYVTWNFMTIDGYLVTATGFINNLLFLIWTYPFNSFIVADASSLQTVGVIILFAAPIISSFLGYYSGYAGFDLNEKFIKLVYEDKKNKENEK